MVKAALVKGGILMSPINKHIHLSLAELKKYVYAEHELTEIQIEHIELELQVCEKCSDNYVSLLENMEFINEPKLTDQKFEGLLLTAEQAVNKNLPIKKKWYEHSVVHIAIAACITGLLFISGFLSVMTNMMNSEPTEETTVNINNDIDDWLKLSEKDWYMQFQQGMKKFELFKEEK